MSGIRSSGVRSKASTIRRLLLRGLVVATVTVGVTSLGGVSAPARAAGSRPAGVPGVNYTAAGIVSLRPTPGTDSGVVLAQTSDRQPLGLRCQTSGENVNGSTIWDYTTVRGRAGYLSDWYVNGTPAGQFDPDLPRCGDPGTRVYGATVAGNGGVGGSCTWGALEQIHNAIGVYPAVSGNAKEWKVSAGVQGWMVVLDAQPRSIVVFQPNVHGADSLLGHVAWVESVETRSDGLYVHILEMNGARDLGGGPWKYDRRVVKDVLGMSYILAP